jgi:hypothetical protein
MAAAPRTPLCFPVTTCTTLLTIHASRRAATQVTTRAIGTAATTLGAITPLTPCPAGRRWPPWSGPTPCKMPDGRPQAPPPASRARRGSQRRRWPLHRRRRRHRRRHLKHLLPRPAWSPPQQRWRPLGPTSPHPRLHQHHLRLCQSRDPLLAALPLKRRCRLRQRSQSRGQPCQIPLPQPTAVPMAHQPQQTVFLAAKLPVMWLRHNLARRRWMKPQSAVAAVAAAAPAPPGAAVKCA